ncbi:MAG: VWA domain-containing protein [Kiritimatiellae bacterium]|nr:VWA domain-containing protein [Kiritimatiellia bacterium]
MAKLWEQDWILERRKPGHTALAGVALVVSLALHVALIEAAPPVMWEAPEADAHTARRAPDIRLREVRRDAPPPPAAPPQPHDPAHPEGALGQAPRPSEFISAVDPVLLQPPEIRAPLAGASAPLATPEPPARTEWTPRQERIELDQKFARTELAARPRRLTPALPRTAHAPDFALPAPRPVTPPAPGAASAITDTELPALLARSSLPGPAAGYSPGFSRRDSFGVPMRLAETSSLFDERPSQITPIAPVERMLRIEVSAWVPDDEPEWRYFTLRIQRDGASSLPVLSKDVLFIMDCSESMTAARIEAAKPGLRDAIARLNPGDRFEIMSFQERPRRCFAQWTPWDIIQSGRANFFIDRMSASGKTDLFLALEQVLQLPRDPARPALALVITDGRPTTGLQDYFEIMQRFTEGNEGRFSMFSIGSGPQANRFLMDFLSYANRGGSTVIERRDALAEGIEQSAREVNRPVLTDLQYRFSGMDEQNLYPRQITHLFMDRPLTLHGRAPTSADTAGLRILGASGEQKHDMVFRLDWPRAQAGSEAVRTQWRWQRLNWLISEHIRTRDPALREEAVRLSNLMGREMPYGADLGILSAPMRMQ